LPAVPGYAIEGLLGRGGMGVVYKARHVALKRTVALKMIRAGVHAGDQERARFKAEAEAVARLQHPNIVQVFEVGEAGGCPFCALEFVEGGSLAQKLRGAPLPPREAAALVEALARGMHLAHARNVVHRDLKPANVLLAADGTPKITDFGLGRQLDTDSRATRDGAVMGTPSCMAPEQAFGRTHEAGPAADVYALGAILYECLTGRPPFKGATVGETLDQVRTQEPVPPHELQPRTPRDLETVCLKCLRKEPERRYASAAELAAELGRFLRGEPVLARRVGRLERTARWARRNPALAAALAGVMIGAVVASWLAVAAWRANDELGHKNTELDNKNTELAGKNEELSGANGKLELQKAELERHQNQLEGTLVRSWLSPLARQPGPLTEPELQALDQVAARQGQPLALRFLREAMTDPALTSSFACRAEHAWRAALGLNRKRRTEAEQLLVPELRAAKPDTTEAQELALAAAALGDLSPETVAVAAAPLIDGITKTVDRKSQERQAQGLIAAAARMEANDAARAAARLSQAISNTKDPVTLRFLAQGASAVAVRMEPKEATLARRTAAVNLIGKIADATELTEWQELGEELSPLTVRLEARQRAEIAATIAQAIGQSKNPGALEYLGQILSAVAAQLDAKEAAAGCRPAAASLAQALTANKTMYTYMLPSLARGLSALASRLEPKEAAEVCGPAAAAIAEVLSKTPATDSYPLERLAKALSALAARMDPEEAAALCGPAAVMLAQIMSKSSSSFVMQAPAQGLSALADRLGTKGAGEAATLLAHAMSKTLDLSLVRSLSQGSSAVAPRLDPRVGGEIAATLASTILTRRGQHGGEYLAEGLSAVAGQMDPNEVAATFATLATAMDKTTDPNIRPSQARWLMGLTSRVGPRHAAEVAVMLTKAMSGTSRSDELGSLAQALSALAPQLERQEASAAAAALTRILCSRPGAPDCTALAQALSALSVRLEPEEGARVCYAAAGALTRTMNGAGTWYVLYYQAMAVSALSARMEHEEAARECAVAAAALAQAMSIETQPGRLVNLGAGLSELASRLGPTEAAELCGPAAAALVRATSNTPEEQRLQILSEILPVLAARIHSEQAAVVCHPVAAALTRCTTKDAKSPTSRVLGNDLWAVLARVAPDASHKQAQLVTALVGSSGPAAGFTAPALVQLGFEPAPPPLPAEMLVDLLKDPLCVGEPQRLVLGQLARHYGRTFADQWEFARFAEEQNLGLDLTSPPRSPGAPVGAAP
jgi:tRNA A-37 threonylcarbamoyl transferase component Bud32